jgi:hypothetical protein
MAHFKLLFYATIKVGRILNPVSSMRKNVRNNLILAKEGREMQAIMTAAGK